MNLTSLRHISSPEHAPEPGTPEAFQGRIKRVHRSPEEELQARLLHHGVEPIPNALVALIMSQKKTLKVTRNGIKFSYRGDEYTYWSADSVSCHPQNAGKPVTITFDRDNLELVHVLDHKLRYVESLPRKQAVEPLSAASRTQYRDNQAVITQEHERLKKLHAIDSRQAQDTARTNAEAIQAVHTFPADPARSPATNDTEIDPSHRSRSGGIDNRQQAPAHGSQRKPVIRTANRLVSDMERAGQRVQAAQQRHRSLERQPMDADDLLAPEDISETLAEEPFFDPNSLL